MFKEHSSDELVLETRGLKDFRAHLEGLDPSLHLSLEEVAGNVYSRGELLDSAARAEWEQVAGGYSPDERFREAYAAFVLDGNALARNAPTQYEFLRERVFAGHEFSDVGTAAQVERGVESLWNLEALRPTVWERLSVSERLSALQEVENRLALVEGRPAVYVVEANLGPGISGQYDFHQICIGPDRLHGKDVSEAVETVAHEGRHCYQHFAVWYPWLHADQNEVAAWRTNFAPGGYVSANLYGYEAYRNQPVERDAWSFGEAVRSGLYGMKGSTS